ncbi:hypothetical protein Dimus_031042 [Dionaea muscipula]
MHHSEQLCVSLLWRCKTLKHIQQLQALISKTGLEPDPYIAGKLILNCAVSIPDSLDYAHRLLLHTPNPDVFMYNTISRGLSESENPENSLVAFTEMRRKSLVPDSFSFAFNLKVAADLRSLEAGIQLHCHALIHGLNAHLFVGTTLTSMYGECGLLDDARRVFDEIPEPNVVAWNAILTACFRGEDVENMELVFDRMTVLLLRDITSWNVMLSGYMKAGNLVMARKLFSEMPLRDGVSWSTMIVGFAQSGSFEEAFRRFRELRQTGMEVTEASLTGVFSSCAQVGAFEFGRTVHGFVEKSGFGLIVSVNNTLLDTYVRCGYIDFASLVFQRMEEKRKNIVTFTSMISGLAMHGYVEEVIQVFREMEESSELILPDAIIFVSVLYACSHAGLIKEGCLYFDKMTRVYGIEPSIEHYGCMVDLYGRAGLVHKAYEFINEMPVSPGAVIWRTLLGACSIHGDVELAERVKERLSELEPDDSGDHVLLSNVYATAGKWKDMAGVRKLMSRRSIIKTPGWSMHDRKSID